MTTFRHAVNLLGSIILLVGGAAGAEAAESQPSGLASICCLRHAPQPADAMPSSMAAAPATAATPIPIAEVPAYSSLPGSTKAIHLVFTGYTIAGTAFNDVSDPDGAGPQVPGYGVWIPQVAAWNCLPFTLDADATTFNDAEQAAILQIWQRVAEDFAPFDVNVTTVAPGAGVISSTCVFTKSKDANNVFCPAAQSIGVSGIGLMLGGASFGNPYRQPALVYIDTINTNGRANAIANDASHEVGHHLGLVHDGLPGQGYYGGHAGSTALTSWAPIMGSDSAVARQVTQWSKGEYPGASSAQNDIQVITNILGLRVEDHPGTVATASAAVPVAQDGTFAASGIVMATTDADAIRFTNAHAGPTTITVSPFICAADMRGGNLDVRLDLYTAGNVLVASANPLGDTVATISVADLAVGEYVVVIGSDGEPFNFPTTGYSNYGSLGQWFLAGSLTSPGVRVGAVAASTGLSTGGLTVTVSGSNFTAGTSIAFGGVPATGVQVVNATTLTCVTPAHGAGTVDVVATNPDGTTSTLAKAFTYVLPPPAIATCHPGSGSAGGGTVVTISGTGFVSGATIRIGGLLVTPTSLTATTIVVTTPAHTNGAVDVVVANPDLQTSTQVGGFTYTGGDSASYQQGVGGYIGTVDVSLDSSIATWNNSNGASNAISGARSCASGSSGPTKVYLLKFTALGLPAGTVVTSAGIDLVVTNWNANTSIPGRYLAKAWNPAGANAAGGYQFGWTNCAAGQLWGAPGASLTGTDLLAGPSLTMSGITNGAGQLRHIDLDPAVVQSWINAPATSNHGIRLAHTTLSLTTTIAGSDDVVIANRPKLVITYTVGPSGFVADLYQHTLLRPADAGGSAWWTGELAASRLSGAGAARGFLASQEFLNRATSNRQYVETLYLALCGRAADAGGLAAWQGALDGGMLRADALDEFLRSAEFAAHCQAYGVVPIAPAELRAMQVRALVRRFYREFLGREPDAGGINGWTQGLVDGDLTGAQLASAFVHSQEYVNRNLSNEAFISAMYRACFDRVADAGGQAGWLGALQDGTTRAQVVDAFTHSPEFINQCTVCGIVAFAPPG